MNRQLQRLPRMDISRPHPLTPTCSLGVVKGAAAASRAHTPHEKLGAGTYTRPAGVLLLWLLLWRLWLLWPLVLLLLWWWLWWLWRLWLLWPLLLLLLWPLVLLLVLLMLSRGAGSAAALQDTDIKCAKGDGMAVLCCGCCLHMQGLQWCSARAGAAATAAADSRRRLLPRLPLLLLLLWSGAGTCVQQQRRSRNTKTFGTGIKHWPPSQKATCTVQVSV